MAQFLIFNKTSEYLRSKPQDCTQRGDVVVVKGDSHVWGSKEAPPDFLRVKAAIPLDEAVVYAKPGKGREPEDDAGVKKLYHISEAECDRIAASGGVVQITQREFNNMMIKKVR